MRLTAGALARSGHVEPFSSVIACEDAVPPPGAAGRICAGMAVERLLDLQPRDIPCYKVGHHGSYPTINQWPRSGPPRIERHAPAMTMTKEAPTMDPIRRNILATGAAAATLAAAPQVFAQQAGQGGKFYEKGSVRIRYDEAGSGFPLLLIAGGGLNSVMAGLATSPFNPIEEFKGEYRCIFADLRNANPGQSSGPLEIDRPWDSYTDDHLGLMDHLGIDKFMVLGFCIGGPFIWNLLKRAPDRVVAAVPAQPVGFRPEMPTVLYDNGMTNWGPELVKRRPEITMEMVNKFLTKMYRTNDFVLTVTRDFVRNCQTPVLIMPDDIPAHPYAVAMECAMLAPKAEVSIYPWKEPKERIALAVRQVRSFLRAHRLASA
jgi:pimeloyl-ACP methyl ester carboxylesterase